MWEIRMMKLMLVLIMFLVVRVYGDNLLRSVLKINQVVLTDAEKKEEAKTYAMEKMNERFAKRLELLDLLPTGVDYVSTAIGAHHTLNVLPKSLKEKVEMAKYYNDYISKLTATMSDDDKKAALEYHNTVIDIPFPGTDTIPKPPDCSIVCTDPTSRFRTMNGMCNNLQNCIWGSVGVTLRRILPAHYEEFNEPRLSERNVYDIAKKEFGITRKESERIVSSRGVSQMAVTWGQMVAHDIISTPATTLWRDDDSPVEVDCSNTSLTVDYEGCFIIQRRNMRRNFIRSAPGIVDKDGSYVFGSREQINAMTSFIDGSHIYGTTNEAASKMYDSATGKMKTKVISPVESEVFPPTDPNIYCEGKEPNECFISGDGRGNIQLGIAMLQILFWREHNHLADLLKASNPAMTATSIYQESRRLVIAEIQKITFEEYLPALIGKEMAKRYGLEIGSGTLYDSTIDPSIVNSFSTAAFRSPHSQIYNMIRMALVDGSLKAKAGLFGTMFNPDRFYASNGQTVMRRYLVGLAHDKCDAIDETFASSMHNVFKSKTPDRPGHSKVGIALPAINLQRGRDHGLPTCGEFRKIIKEQTGDTPNLPDDEETNNMDLYECGLRESAMPDSEVGYIFGHIIALQFRKILLGDRYAYSHTNTPDSVKFSEAQREEIRKVTLSSLMCRHAATANREGQAEQVLNIVQNPFFAPTNVTNPIQNCLDILASTPNVSVFV